MEVTAERIAQHFNGEIIGDPQAKVSSVAKIESGKSGNICFLANPKYEKYLYTSKASIVIINRCFKPDKPVEPTLILVDNAYEAVASLLDLLNALKRARRSGRSLLSRRAWSSRIGKGVYIGAFSCVGKKSVVGKGTQIYPQVYIGNDVVIGENVTLYQGVKIYDGCKVGNNCIIHANAVIGSDGFGFAPTADGSYKKIPQTGNVVIEDDVEIGANTVIDRATMGSTTVRRGVKIFRAAHRRACRIWKALRILHSGVPPHSPGSAGITHIPNLTEKWNGEMSRMHTNPHPERAICKVRSM